MNNNPHGYGILIFQFLNGFSHTGRGGIVNGLGELSIP